MDGTPQLQEAIAASPGLSAPPEPIYPSLEKQFTPISVPPSQTKTLPSVASLLNSPVKETMPRLEPQTSWSEPVAPTPLVPQAPSLLPLPIPDLEHDSARMRSPSNISEISRSQSQNDYYGRPDITRQTMYPGQSVRDDRYYREDPRSQSIPPPPRYISSPQPNLLPPVRIHEQSPLGQQSPYYPSPRYEPMPPPAPVAHEPSYVRESYSRSPVQHRSALSAAESPLPPPATLPPPNRDVYYQERDPRYPYPRERYYERDDREYYRYEDDGYRGYDRDRLRSMEEERVRERTLTRESEQDWGREYTENYPPRYPPRPRSPYRSGDYETWRRMEDMRQAELYERERLERERMDRDRLDRERWNRR